MKISGLMVAAVALMAAQAQAQNLAPPPGAILDLAGQPLPTAWTQYTTSFTASLANTDITFAFRNDPGFTALDDVSVSTGAGPNLIQNPGFEGGTYTSGVNPSAPNDWNYLNQFGASYSGVVSPTCTADPGIVPHSGGSLWCDGSVQAYDSIDQVIATTPGDVYDISFWLDQQDVIGADSGIFLDVSGNGQDGINGDGIDTLVYAQVNSPIGAVPEPASLALFGAGLTGFGLFRRRRKA